MKLPEILIAKHQKKILLFKKKIELENKKTL